MEAAYTRAPSFIPIVGQRAEEAYDENTWFMKHTCDYRDGLGNTVKDVNCEACTIGTTDNPRLRVIANEPY